MSELKLNSTAQKSGDKAGWIKAIAPSKLLVICRGLSDDAVVPLAQRAAETGASLEIALRDRQDAQQIPRLKDLEGICAIGAGTVTNLDLAEVAIDAGADFVLSPNVDPEVIRYCVSRNVPIMAGALTPSEVVVAAAAGASAIKVFPAGSMGPGYIQQLRGPLADYSYVAVGGISSANCRSFIESGCDAVAVGGSITTSAEPLVEFDRVLAALKE